MKGQRLKDQAQEREFFARQRARERPQDSTVVEGDDAGELVDALLSKPAIVGPSILDIYVWVAKMRGRGERGTLSMTIRNGKIS